jgi:hydrogenase/urease accessory protein HupE
VINTSNLMVTRDETYSARIKIMLLILSLAALFLSADLAYAHGMSEEEKQAIIDGGNWQYMWLGATHMLSGYDHLAFVFGIIFFLTSFREIAKYVTAFTLGHSVTLIYATFNAIQLNYFLIDAVIALSVCYIAFSNIDGFRKYLNIAPPNMMLMIIALGLIHGFGLSTRLQELPLSDDALLLNIIAFNLGIEIGQIGALFAMLILIAAWRKSEGFKAFSLMANYSLIAMGIYLFFMQMHGYEHTVNAEEFSIGEAPISRTEGVGVVEWQDTLEIVLPARSDTEFKIEANQGSQFSYMWSSGDVPLFFDFHGEPKNDSSGSFKSYKKGTESTFSGSAITSFEGTHGWYWKNSTTSPVTISLSLQGGYRLISKNNPPKPEPAQPEKRHKSIGSL